MKLSGVIKELEGALLEIGDVDVFLNPMPVDGQLVSEEVNFVVMERRRDNDKWGCFLRSWPY